MIDSSERQEEYVLNVFSNPQFHELQEHSRKRKVLFFPSRRELLQCPNAIMTCGGFTSRVQETSEEARI